MRLLTKAIRAKLIKNNLERPANVKPVVKFFNPIGAATWLIADMDKDGLMFGLCDLGMGFPELGYVSYYELANLKLPLGLGIERDLHWAADKTLSEYANEAAEAGRIVA
jgi:hypothetical protein